MNDDFFSINKAVIIAEQKHGAFKDKEGNIHSFSQSATIKSQTNSPLNFTCMSSKHVKEGEAFVFSEIEDPITKEVRYDVMKIVSNNDENSKTKLSYLEIANSLPNDSFFITRRKSFFKKQCLENIDYKRFDEYVTMKLFEYQNKNDDIWVYLVKNFNSLCISFLKDLSVRVY